MNKKQKVSPKPETKIFTNQVTFNDSFKQTIDTYKQKGYGDNSQLSKTII